MHVGSDVGSDAVLGASGAEAQTSPHATNTSWVNQLEFAVASSHRTAMMALATMNVILALLTAAAIFSKSWKLIKAHDVGSPIKTFGFSLLHSASAFPFVLASGIVFQGIIFIISQSRGLATMMITGCVMTSRFMLPAFLITPFIHIIFGLEMASRAVRQRPFPEQGRWNIIICHILLVTALVVAFVSTFAVSSPDECFASLFWFLQPYKLVCLSILMATVVISLVSGVIIFFRLLYGVQIGIRQRATASHMVYFLGVATVLNSLLVPLFVQFSFANPTTTINTTLQLCTVATVVSNLSGMITCGLYLYLRSSTNSLFGPSARVVTRFQELEKGSDSASSLDYHDQLARPVSPPKRPSRRESTENLIVAEKHETKAYTESLYSKEGGEPMNPVLEAPRPVAEKRSTRQSIRGLIAKHRDGALSDNVYGLPISPKDKTARASPPRSPEPDMDLSAELLAPPRIHDPEGHARSRGSSMFSTAIVQIGLRLSSATQMPTSNDANGTPSPAMPSPAMPSPAMPSPGVQDLRRPTQGIFEHRRKNSPLIIPVVNTATEEDPRWEVQEKELPPVPLSQSEIQGPGQVKTGAVAVQSPTVQTPAQVSPSHSARVHHQGSYSVSSQDPDVLILHTQPELQRQEWI